MSDRTEDRQEPATQQSMAPPAIGSPPQWLIDLGLGLLTLVIFSAIAWGIYARALNFPFIFDDQLSVVSHTSITQRVPLWGEAESHSDGPLAPPWDSPTAGRPLVNLSLALNYYFGQLD